MTDRQDRGRRSAASPTPSSEGRFRALAGRLDEAEERFRVAFENAPIGIGLVSPDRRWLQVNRALCEITGYDAAALLEKTPRDITHPDDRDADTELVRRMLAGEIRTAEAEKRFIRANGSSVWVLLSVALVRDADDRPRYLISQFVDIDQRKRANRAEEALRAAEERYRDLFEQSPIGIAQVTAEGVPVAVNPTWASLMGYDSPERFVAEVASTSELYEDPADREAMTAAVAEHGAARGFEVRLRRRDGTTVWVAMDVRAVTNAAGDLVGLQGSGVDISERKRIEQDLRDANDQLETANRAKDRFLANMSHELRTPLNAILGFTGTLLMGLPGPLNEAQAKQLRTVQSSGKHLLSLINDLLDLARIESGKVELNIESIDCKNLLQEVAVGLRPLADDKGIALGVLAPDELQTNSDRRALKQILINLTNNAIKFTDHGAVGLELSRLQDERGWVTRFNVTDTGRGIEAHDQERLFAEFEQVGTRSYEGSGLGLHICRALAELIGATISFQSEYGKGSVFTLDVPN